MMFLEAVGLPGSGKSTILIHAVRQLKRTGSNAEFLKMVAPEAMAAEGDSNRFLKKSTERLSMYGCFSYGAEHPELFDLMVKHSRSELPILLWNMEMLSQLYFVEKRGDPAQLVFIDEGFLHRGAASFLISRAEEDFLRYIDTIPTGNVVIKIETTPEVAAERALGRKKRLPIAVRGKTEEETLENLRWFKTLIDLGCDRFKANGGTVIEVDANLALKRSSALLLRQIGALAGTAGAAAADKTAGAPDEAREQA